MEKIKTSEFVLYGSRDYVHSTTIWNFLLQCLNVGDVVNARIVYKKKLQEQADAYISEGRVPVVEGSFADLYVKSLMGEYVISLKSNGVKVIDAVPYDEDAFLGDNEISPSTKEIVLKHVDVKHLINVLVVSNKILLQKVLSSEGMTSWVMGKINLDYSALEKAVAHGDLRLQLDNVLANQYTKVSVYVGDKKYGVLESARKRR